MNRIGREFRIDAHVIGFQTKDTILYLGFEVNILPGKMWEALGKPQMKFSPIQMWMADQ